MILEANPNPMRFSALPIGHPRTVLHLLSCVECREAAVSELLPPAEPMAGPREEPRAPPWCPAQIAAEALPVDRAASTLALRDSEESTIVIARLVDTLEQLPTETLSQRWKAKRFAKPEVLAELLTRGEGCLRTEPQRAERLGLVGVVLGGRLDDDERWVPPGVVSSELLVGASRRLQGKLKEAGQVFQQVSVFLADDLEEADYARELALLRWEQGRSCDAAALLTQAAERYFETDKPDEEATCWALLGLLRREEASIARMARAKTPLLRSLPALDGGTRPYLELRVRLALALCEAERCDHQKAQAWLDGSRTLVTGIEEIDSLRQPRLAFAWTQGQVVALGDRPQVAEASLVQVRATLMAAGRLGEATLVSLDLARIAAKRANLDRGSSLADELAFRFQGHAGLVFALQALADFEESLSLRPGQPREAYALASRFLRQSFRAKGLSIEPPPIP